jgi:hypothetical protein
VLSSSCRDLAIGHLVHGFNRKDMTFESFVLKTLFKLTFGLAGTNYLDGICATNASDDSGSGVEAVELVPELSVPRVFRRAVFGCLCST